MSKPDLSLVTRALDFAARAHRDHRRKGKAAEPYVNHLTEVAALAGEASGWQDPVVIAAALLHDTNEDCDVTYDDLKAEFGQQVADVVQECTDPPGLQRKQAKAHQLKIIHGLSARAKLVKLADKTSNLRAIDRTPPTNWSRERKIEYVEFGRAIFAATKGAAPSLDRAFRQVSDDLGRKLGMDSAPPAP
ncbi:MAG: HD domain-containing protein [Alphaproteobacteria bacterium]